MPPVRVDEVDQVDIRVLVVETPGVPTVVPGSTNKYWLQDMVSIVRFGTTTPARRNLTHLWIPPRLRMVC